MIVLMKRKNIMLVALIFLLLLAIYSLNIGADGAPASVTGPEGQIVVVLDAGHGGEDPGSVSDYSGLAEKDVNLKVTFKAKELLEKEGYKVILTREEDILQYKPGTTEILDKRKQDLTRRKSIMDQPEVDIAVSIHLNKFDQTQYYGAQVFFPHNSQKSQKLAECIQSSFKENVDSQNNRKAMLRGKANETPIIIFRNLKTPTVLVECGFLSHAEEEKKLATDEYQGKLALAIKEGINLYFNSKK